MKDTVRVGVVGLGPRGRSVLRLSAGFPGVEIVSVCDIKPSNFYEKCWQTPASISELFPDAVYYESYDEMLANQKLDVVIVETGADIHASFCVKALERDINVLSDIPNVASLPEAEALWKAQKSSKAFISTGANPNYQKFTFLLREFYELGLLGEPYCMEAEYIHWSLPGSDFNIHYNENGNWRKLLIPIRYCTHSLGPLLTILKEDLRYVSCFGTGKHSPESKKDDMMCAQFQTESGVVVRLMRNGRCRAQIGHHNYRVFGTEGYMERIDRFDKPVIRYNTTRDIDKSLHEIGGEFMPPAYADNPEAKGHGGMDYAMLDAFFKAVKAGGHAPVTLKEGLAMTLPGIYAEESAKRRGEVLRMVYPWDPDWSAEVK